MYKIIALIGEAGVGKDTLMKEFLKQHDFHEIISCTTRPPREGEKNGVNYFYYSEKDFLEKVNKNEMLEYTSFRDWLYGTSYDSVVKDKINIGVFNPDGILSLLKRNDIDLQVVRITARDKTRLLRQLNRESSPDVEEIIGRYKTDKEDFKKINNIDYTELDNDGIFSIGASVTQILIKLDNWIREAETN